jgi:hypothetical protein
MMRWRKDKQDIEVITGYTPRSDRRIQIPEYEEEGGGGESTELNTERSPKPEDT